MKTLKLLPVLFALFCLMPCVFLFGCKGISGDSTKSFIPGAYTSYARGAYSIARDTLVIQTMSEKEGTYRVLRKTAFRRIRGGKLMPAEKESEQWLAVYDPMSGSLEVKGSGKIIRADPGSGLLVVGDKPYKKLEIN